MNQYGFKLIILDEADSMTGAAQAALRRGELFNIYRPSFSCSLLNNSCPFQQLTVIEIFTNNVRFCLICNYAGKIIPALQSRCTRFRFGPLSHDQIEPRLRSIAEKENLTFDSSGIRAILRLSQGDMRKSLNILQSTAASYQSHITELNVYLCTGDPLPSDVEKMVTWMLNDHYNIAYANVLELKTTKGLALCDIIREVHSFLQQANLPAKTRIFVLEKLADIEYHIAQGCHEKLQLSALVGLLQLAAGQMA
jgi:replication factor C subunit 3/5